jgi:hypothetical protein
MRLRTKIGLVVIVLGSMFLWGRCSRKSNTQTPKPSAVLPPNDVEQIRVNPATRQLTVTTSAGTRTVTLPDTVSTIDVLKNGKVSVTSPQFGFEHHLFGGWLVSDNGRLGIGEDLLYFRRLDLGLGVAGKIGSYDPIAFAKLSYNVKGNVQVGLVYGSNQYVGGGVFVRLF